MPGVVTIIREDGLTFSFDGEESIGFAPSATVTQQPVEDGSAIGDHSQRQNDPISIAGVVTNSPLLAPGQQGTFGRTQEAVEFLESILGQPVTLVVASEQVSRSYEDVVLSEMPHTVTMLNELTFAAQFVQVRIARAQVVQIPPERPRAPAPPAADGTASEVDKRVTMSDEQDVGEQPPRKELPPEKAAEDDRSFLAKALDGDLLGGT